MPSVLIDWVVDYSQIEIGEDQKGFRDNGKFSDQIVVETYFVVQLATPILYYASRRRHCWKLMCARNFFAVSACLYSLLLP